MLPRHNKLFFHGFRRHMLMNLRLHGLLISVKLVCRRYNGCRTCRNRDLWSWFLGLLLLFLGLKFRNISPGTSSPIDCSDLCCSPVPLLVLFLLLELPHSLDVLLLGCSSSCCCCGSVFVLLCFELIDLLSRFLSSVSGSDLRGGPLSFEL